MLVEFLLILICILVPSMHLIFFLFGFFVVPFSSMDTGLPW